MMWILVILAAAVAYAVASMRRRSVPQPEPKVFTLKLARAARGFITNSEQAKAVKAVVVGILKYEDRIADEAAEEVDELRGLQARHQRRQEEARAEIDELKQEIETLDTSNRRCDEGIADLNALSDLFV